MNKVLILLAFVSYAFMSYAQTDRPEQYVTSSIPNEKAKYLLFPTKNIFTFLKLNTRNGLIHIVQYSLDKDDGRLQVKLNDTPLVEKKDESNGRFFLYPTTNIYNFLLLDQIDGRMWQVQWSGDKEKRFVTKIYDDTVFHFDGDSIKICDLEIIDGLYYFDRELFSGFVTSNDGKTISMFVIEGKNSFGASVKNDNGQIVISMSKASKGIEDEGENHYEDENEQDISLKEFKEKYPELFERAKKQYEDFKIK